MVSYFYDTRAKVMHFFCVADADPLLVPFGVSHRVSVASQRFRIPERTIRNWLFEGDITCVEYEENLSKRGRKRKFSEDVENNIVH